MKSPLPSLGPRALRFCGIVQEKVISCAGRICVLGRGRDTYSQHMKSPLPSLGPRALRFCGIVQEKVISYAGRICVFGRGRDV